MVPPFEELNVDSQMRKDRSKLSGTSLRLAAGQMDHGSRRGAVGSVPRHLSNVYMAGLIYHMVILFSPIPLCPSANSRLI